jgi:hypothetical protein
MLSLPVINLSRLRHCESTVYAKAHLEGSREFQAFSTASVFNIAFSFENGGMSLTRVAMYKDV